MNAFYSKISEFRKKCIESELPSSFYFNSSSLYTKLMTALSELNAQDQESIFKFEQHIPEKQEELFHYLWFLNAKARYECFVKHDYSKALILTNSISGLVHRFFVKDFEEDNLEKRSLIFILALNYTRLSFYTKNYALCLDQVKELKAFFLNTPSLHWEHFPEALRLMLNQHGHALLFKMNQEQKDYFLIKMNKIEEKLEKQVLI